MPKPFQVGLDHQTHGRWHDAIASYEAAIADDSGEKPFVRGYPRRGDRFDQWHRLAFCRRMAGDDTGAARAYAEAATLDPAIAAWVERFASRRPGPDEAAHAARLWRLVTRPESQTSAADARALIDATAVPTVFPDGWWSMAYTYLYQAGWPTAAYAAKDTAARVLVETMSGRVPTTPALAMDVARAIADTGDHAGAAAGLAPLVAGDVFGAAGSGELRDLLAGLVLLASCSGSPSGAADALVAAGPESPDDAAFRALVAGRRIAVVAPAETGASQGAEIDGFDLVVRTNFRDHAIIAARRDQIGARTDIAYYNGNFEPEHRDRIAATLAVAPLRFLVLRYDDEEAFARYRPLLPVRATRIASPYYRMNSYAIPKIVFDLLQFAPASIKVFNADFFLGDHAHYAGYLDYDIRRVQSFLQHDVLRNIRMLQVLHRAGRIEADPVLARLLAAQEPELLERIGRRVAEHLPHERPARR